MKKYELTDDVIGIGLHILHRIKAVRDFGHVKCGDLGGFVESEINLSHGGNAWIGNDAHVLCGASVSDDALVCGNARIFGDANVSGNAIIYGNAMVYDNAKVFDDAKVFENANVSDNAIVYGDAMVYGNAKASGNARVYGYAKVSGNVILSGEANIENTCDYTACSGYGRKYRTTIFYRLKNGDIGVSCGCFVGTLDEFRDKVRKTHGGNKYAKEYLLMADLQEIHFGQTVETEVARNDTV